MLSKISTTDDVSRDFSSQIEKFKAMQLISENYVRTFTDLNYDSDDYNLDWTDPEEFMRLEGVTRLFALVGNPELLYSYALLPLAYFNAQHKTDFEFHKFVRAYFNQAHPMYIVFEAISPTIAGGLPLVFQSHIGLRPGWPSREEVYFCKLHPIDCSYTLDDLPVSSSTPTFDHTKACVLAAAAFAICQTGLTLKDIVSFEEIAEPTLVGEFDVKYKIIFNVFKIKDASFVAGPVEIVVEFRQEFQTMDVISIVKNEMPNEVKEI
ncbi:uncharacterized protein LOC124933435 [Impatiens glandulifera]|uniref:uncharacterized protein LOC124933435 n=1 Tax=Impatiens glandulifera TaxID=253017 RepID=UPI001FB14CE4|nr:uncharacterized protein LOC124933435 [Impatiens glandulifera]